jgi:hypothetical protein
MPIVTAYSGSITLRASAKPSDDPFFTLSKVVYGKSLGELFDNLVEASVRVARDAERWTRANKASDYSLSEDYWRLSVTLPDIIKCQKKTQPNLLDSSFDSRVFTIDEIVIVAVSNRDIRISQANTYLQLVLPGSSALPNDPAVSLYTIEDSETLEEKMARGWTGKDLEEILEIARKEHRIDTLNAMDKYDERLSKYEKSLINSHGLKSGRSPRKRWSLVNRF